MLAILFLSVFGYAIADKIVIEDFGSCKMTWTALNDPVMGGQSSSTVAVEAGLGKFNGEVVDVPSLQAPGFVSMESKGGPYPDVSSCKGLGFEARTATPYKGYRFSFGSEAVDGARYARGFKTRFDVESEFSSVDIDFADFSDNWDGKTGDVKVGCKEDKNYCPSEQTLRNMGRIEFQGEGVNGVVSLEVRKVYAYGCDSQTLKKVEEKAAVPLSAVALAGSLLVLFSVMRMRMREKSDGTQVVSSADDDNELL